MIVTFTSRATGEIIMMSEIARPLLKAMNKTCDAQGVITQPEIPAALLALERYLEKTAPLEKPQSEEEEKDTPPMLRPVSIRQRAWPLIDMLKRNASAKKDSHILWQAAASFESSENAGLSEKAAPENCQTFGGTFR